MQVSLLRAIGGVILIVIAIRLLVGQGDDQRARFASQNRLLPAILTILLADATMSLDNVLAVGALAHGDIWLLVAGLLVSMALLFVASALIARIVERFTWLIDLAAVVLAWTAAGLFLDDALVKSQLPALEPWGSLCATWGRGVRTGDRPLPASQAQSSRRFRAADPRCRFGGGKDVAQSAAQASEEPDEAQSRCDTGLVRGLLT